MRSIYFLELENKNIARADCYAQFTAGFVCLNQRGFLRALALKNGNLAYADFVNSLQGWLGYTKWANTYKMRKKIIERIKLI
jgi:hypothetical protein